MAGDYGVRSSSPMRTSEIIGITKAFLLALAITSASAAYAATLKSVPAETQASALTEVAFSAPSNPGAL